MNLNAVQCAARSRSKSYRNSDAVADWRKVLAASATVAACGLLLITAPL